MTPTTTMTVLTKKDFQTDQEVRWCPGCGDYAILSAVQSIFPELGIPARKIRGGLGHRLLQPLPLLHEYLRLSHHSRPRARGSHGNQARASRTRSLGRHRRRRFALHRRQSHHSHVAPQRGRQSADVQQPHLRPHQGPVFADFGIRQEDQVHSVRLRRAPVQSAGAGDRRGGHVRGPLGGRLPAAPEGHAQERPPRTTARPTSRFCRIAISSTTAPGYTSPKKRLAASISSSSNTASRWSSARIATRASA